MIRGEKVTWVDLENPTAEELTALSRTYTIHPIVASELLKPTFRPKVEDYEHFLYLILHFPVYDARGADHGREIDFIIGKDFLITTRYHKSAVLEGYFASLRDDKNLHSQYLSEDTGKLLYHILSQLFAESLKELEIMDKKITRMANRIFLEHSKNMVRRISVLRREVLDFRRAVQPQESVLTSLEEQGRKFYGKDMAPYLNNIIGDYLRVWHMLENHKETIEAVHETHQSLISTRTAEITKNLTIMAFVTFPLTLIASLFGMNTQTLPIVGTPHDFWIIVGIMMVGIIGMFLLFKHKRWI